MSRIIESTYEINEKIGSGGAGVVYLGRHLRLGKQVVLKADKRTLAAKPEVLRREVDALKDLNHMYIPQVYDFVTEGDTVYTVMDYIEGESLDKPLKRGERFPQPHVIEWACELLEALSYLHSRPPHGILHSDIKPANIMLTPQGDIRLIDFNIALALGEEGTVRLGYSSGYASPEHYMLDYSAYPADADATQLLAQTTTSTLRPRTRSGHPVVLDVRSDIYSLGATLYHLLTGIRPAADAKKVVPISTPDVSAAVAGIIRKSMDPDPNRRYQTAVEMLWAFEHLHENDSRTILHKKRRNRTIATLAALFLCGGALALAGLKQMERASALEADRQAAAAIAAEKEEAMAREAEEREREAKQALDAIRNSENAYTRGDVPAAITYALSALRTENPYISQAQKALTGALGVYELSDGFKAHRLIELPSEPLKLSLSPRGTRTAAMTSGLLSVFDTESGETLATLPAADSALSDVVFGGEDLVYYAGAEGLCAYDLVRGCVKWKAAPATGITLSADGGTLAAVFRDDNQALIYDADTGTLRYTLSFDGRRQRVVVNDKYVDQGDNLFALNADGTVLAASFEGGGLKLFNLADRKKDVEIYDSSAYIHFEGGFSGKYFAVAATEKNGASVFAVIDLKEMSQTGGLSSSTRFSTHVKENGIYLKQRNILVRMDLEASGESELAYTESDIRDFDTEGGYTITATQNGALSFFDENAVQISGVVREEPCDFARLAGEYAAAASLSRPEILVLKFEGGDDSQLFSYDPPFKHVEARVSADRQTVMLFRHDQFRLYSMDGEVLSETAIPDAAQVYDQQYRREVACLEVIYNSGLIRRYSAADGSLISEEQGKAPDGSITEEFETKKWRIVSPLHGSPQIFDRGSGEQIGELESEDYLTYVTETGPYVVTEYATAKGGTLRPAPERKRRDAGAASKSMRHPGGRHVGV